MSSRRQLLPLIFYRNVDFSSIVLKKAICGLKSKCLAYNDGYGSDSAIRTALITHDCSSPISTEPSIHSHSSFSDEIYTSPSLAGDPCADHEAITDDYLKFGRGLVHGALVEFTDSPNLRLRRRAKILWTHGRPKTVLLVKKHMNSEATKLLYEIGTFLQNTFGATVYVETGVARQFPQFRQFVPKPLPDLSPPLDSRSNPGCPPRPLSDDPRISASADSNDDPSSPLPPPSPPLSSPPPPPSPPLIPTPVDLIITLGGDGTVLHSTSLFPNDESLPPLLSFAMGTLGFLTPFEAHEYRETLAVVMSEDTMPLDCTLRTRKRCEVFTEDGHIKAVHHVLNECVLDRGSHSGAVTLEMFSDGVFVSSADADGLIVSTPSGSTAYSMSAGGPMVAPSVPCTVITPIAPHSLSFRPLVLSENSSVLVHLPAHRNRDLPYARVSFDGKHAVELPKNGSLMVSAALCPLPLLSRGGHDADWFEGIT
eukprot:CAMPEP_0175083146 /NCGR_PEP_ID=MMETSP0052_2-20121109/27182_1 /TAXON_ID=51329 ORGANISM="Polytomella parva, Strain SAG 63-3" /NCGR_SAMPLE_ID=MMETSP0052_2 /ASSEMBLY_ACC=CAM_ASM_000194 /LENGTH=480 /DNA_ID=CAMNT_0016354487 /DNA_START=308 /DNA_END=1747 /DNA_ORIENTATION=-